MLNPDYRDILSAFSAEKVEFLRNKRASGRLKDLADVERLENADGSESR